MMYFQSSRAYILGDLLLGDENLSPCRVRFTRPYQSGQIRLNPGSAHDSIKDLECNVIARRPKYGL